MHFFEPAVFSKCCNDLRRVSGETAGTTPGGGIFPPIFCSVALAGAVCMSEGGVDGAPVPGGVDRAWVQEARGSVDGGWAGVEVVDGRASRWSTGRESRWSTGRARRWSTGGAVDGRRRRVRSARDGAQEVDRRARLGAARGDALASAGASGVFGARARGSDASSISARASRHEHPRHEHSRHEHPRHEHPHTGPVGRGRSARPPAPYSAGNSGGGRRSRASSASAPHTRNTTIHALGIHTRYSGMSWAKPSR